jgi:hypothetical protein
MHGVSSADHQRGAYWCRSADYVQCYRTWAAVVAVRCKIANCSVKGIRYTVSWNRYHLYIVKNCFMIGFFYSFTCKGTVLWNNVFFFNMLWRSAVRSRGAKSEKPVLHREPPSLKNRSLQTDDFKILQNCWRTLVQVKTIIPNHNLAHFFVELSL